MRRHPPSLAHRLYAHGAASLHRSRISLRIEASALSLKSFQIPGQCHASRTKPGNVQSQMNRPGIYRYTTPLIYPSSMGGSGLAFCKRGCNSISGYFHLVLLVPKSHPLIKEIDLKTPVYGLTGGIASGKSTVLAQFAALGIETLDTDQLARDVIAQGTSGALQLETAIGSEYFQDGCLDRARLRSDMYQSAHLKKTVEADHPSAGSQCRQSMARSTVRLAISNFVLTAFNRNQSARDT